MRRVSPLVVSLSEDLALALRFAGRMPRLLRTLLDGLGTPDAQSADLMSYLLFDSAYTRRPPRTQARAHSSLKACSMA